MKYLKSYQQLNELHKDTYRSAVSKLRQRGGDRDNDISKSIINHADLEDPATNSYLETALWVDDPVERFLDVDIDEYDGDEYTEMEELMDGKSFDIYDFTQESRDIATLDLLEFRQRTGGLLDGVSDSTIGHNLYLSRNGHGAGFFDTNDIDDQAIKDRLQDIAETLGSVTVYMCDGYEKIAFEKG